MKNNLRSLLRTVAIAAAPLMLASIGHAQQAKPNQFWWPEQLDLSPLRRHSAESNPMGKSFNYAKEFATLDLKAVKQDIQKVLTTSVDWCRPITGTMGLCSSAWRGTARVLIG